MPSISANLDRHGRLGHPFYGSFATSGFTGGHLGETPQFYAAGLPSGLALDIDEGLLTGTPEEAGIFNILVRAATTYGYATFAFQKADLARKIIIEGNGWLAPYHLDWTDPDAPVARHSLDLQFDLATRAFTSATIDLEAGLDLWLGGAVELHPLITRTGCNSHSGALNLLEVEDLSLTIRARDQFDSPPFIQLVEISGTTSMELPGGDAVDVPAFEIALAGRRFERLFRELNAPRQGVAESAAIPADLSLSFTHASRRVLTPRVPVNLRQPL